MSGILSIVFMAVAGRGDMFDIVLELLIMVRLGASNAPRRTIIRQLSYYILHLTHDHTVFSADNIPVIRILAKNCV